MNKPVIYAGIIVLLAAAGIGLFLLTAQDNAGDGNRSVDTANETEMIVAAASRAVEAGPWNISGPGPVWKLWQADDGMLYSFQGPYGNTIRAICPNGSIKWEYQVPGEWRVSNMVYRQIKRENFVIPGVICPVFSFDNDTMFLYVRENKTTDFNHNLDEEHPGYNQYRDYLLKEKIIAIADGQLLWDVPISGEHHSYEDSNVYAQNGRVYVFDDYSVKVFSDNGTLMFCINNASSPPAVDDRGNIYIVPGIESQDWMPNNFYSIYQYAFAKIPANVVEAYSPDGTLIWQKDAGSPIVRPRVIADLLDRYDTLPLYCNHTLYVPTGYGMMALDTGGNVKWSKKYDYPIELLSTLPIDENGSVYFRGGKSSAEFGGSLIHIVSPDGSELVNDMSVNLHSGGIFGDNGGNVIYSLQDGYEFPPFYLPGNNSMPTLLSGLYLTSYDLRSSTMLVRQKIEQNRTSVILNDDNYRRLLSLDIKTDKNILLGTDMVRSQIIGMTSDTVYVYYLDATYDMPIVFNNSSCTYSSDIYAFDKTSGEQLWQKPLDTIVTSAIADSETFSYGTRDGMIYGGITRDRPEPVPVAAFVPDNAGKVAGEVAGGVAVTAAAVLFLKMFVLGGFTRARLAKNDNRNRVLEYIAGHPGSTLHEIAHGLGVNVGTIRYHLLVLGLNHRVATFQSDGKYVRYFTNSGSYTKDEQYYLSLVRRDPIRKILHLLLDRAELSNLEISEALEMHDSATSRYLKELATRGLVERRNADGGRTAFAIRGECRDPVAAAIERIGDD